MPYGPASASAAQKLGGIICETAASERAVNPERERSGNEDNGVAVVSPFPAGQINAPDGNGNH